MKIDTTREIIDFYGVPVKTEKGVLTVKELVIHLLSNQNQTRRFIDAYKAFHLIKTFLDGDTAVVDNADMDLLIKVVENDVSIRENSDWMRGQLIDYFKNIQA